MRTIPPAIRIGTRPDGYPIYDEQRQDERLAAVTENTRERHAAAYLTEQLRAGKSLNETLSTLADIAVTAPTRTTITESAPDAPDMPIQPPMQDISEPIGTLPAWKRDEVLSDYWRARAARDQAAGASRPSSPFYGTGGGRSPFWADLAVGTD
jgi:hypothetical protein